MASLTLTSSLLPSKHLNRNLQSSPSNLATQQFQVPHELTRAGKGNPCQRLRPTIVARQNSDVVGVPNSVPVRVAYELLQAGHRYLDVRTEDEFSTGHAPGAINIPYMFKFGNGMTKNPNFLGEVSSHFQKHDEIIVGCQSGKRSLMAAADLSSAGSLQGEVSNYPSLKVNRASKCKRDVQNFHGFTGITDIAGGFSAWTKNRLPTE